MHSEPDVTERRMFGGVAFLLGGHMAVVASGHGGLMIRVEAERGDEIVETGAAELAVLRDRPMRGWLRIATDNVPTQPDLAHWVDMSVAYVRTLPVQRDNASTR